MTQRQRMTLLQRAVIQRLREAGFSDTADLARRAWSTGQPLLPQISAYLDDGIRDDFFRANMQANRPPD